MNPRMGCSNSNLSKQDKGTFGAALELSSAGSVIILFLPLLASKHRQGHFHEGAKEANSQ